MVHILNGGYLAHIFYMYLHRTPIRIDKFILTCVGSLGSPARYVYTHTNFPVSYAQLSRLVREHRFPVCFQKLSQYTMVIE